MDHQGNTIVIISIFSHVSVQYFFFHHHQYHTLYTVQTKQYAIQVVHPEIRHNFLPMDNKCTEMIINLWGRIYKIAVSTVIYQVLILVFRHSF